jgi:uncharacterized protein YndB with AHSA1/START domain
MMTTLPHSLERSLVIRAPRAIVFRYFTDPARFALWWGEGSSIEGRVGGDVRIRHPNEVVACGTVEAIEPDRRIAFTYGYENSHPELPPGRSLVTIELDDHADGTLLRFRHDLPTADMRDQHVPGWRYHLAVFANVVANERNAGVAATIDRWFEAWAEQDADRRRELLAACATDEVAMRDRFSCLMGRDELHGHIANTHVHVPGLVMQRSTEPRHCQGTVLFEWSALGPDGQAMANGTNVARLAADGRITDVVGF